jgi:predicted GIY-YIG superfamily endonuclease
MPASQTLLFPDPRPLVERLGQNFFRQLTEKPGVYLMRDATGLVLYVGKAKNLRKRLGSYRVANPDRLGRRHLRLLRAVERIELQECADEAAALARESELLLELKPKFNRAGVWLGPPRFLIWRRNRQTLELAIAGAPVKDWQVFGPFGSAAVYLRAALARLLWHALNRDKGFMAMPEGWLHGRLGTIAIVTNLNPNDKVEAILEKLFTGDTDGFVGWVGERTKALAKAYELEMRDADLETVVDFVQAKARRTKPFATPVPGNRVELVVLELELTCTDEESQRP